MLSRVRLTVNRLLTVISDQTLYSSCRFGFPRLPAGSGKASRSAPASLTAECAAVLPLFLMVIVTLLVFTDLFGTLSAKRLTLLTRAEQIAAAGAGPQWVRLSASCPFELPFALPGIRTVRLAAGIRVRSFTGADPDSFSQDDAGGDSTAVYVTDYESVYHTRQACTHLSLAVMQSDTARIGQLRNAYGNRYKKCDGFPAGYTGPVYLTANGDRYYPSADYPGLKRHVHITSADEAEGLALCERCAHAS